MLQYIIMRDKKGDERRERKKHARMSVYLLPRYLDTGTENERQLKTLQVVGRETKRKRGIERPCFQSWAAQEAEGCL